jgi:VCBS repeat-containing protein
MSLEAQIKDIAKKIEKYRRADANEHETKNGLIRPLFEKLGWKFDDLETIRHEFKVFLDGEYKPADYAYQIDNRVTVLMEAKKINEKLEVAIDDGTRKAVTASVPWVIATNGDSIALLMVDKSISEQERSVFQTTLSYAIHDEEALSHAVACLQLLTPDSINYGSLGKFAKREIKKKRMRSALEATLKSQDFQNLVNANYEQLYASDQPDPELLAQAIDKIAIDADTHGGTAITPVVDEENTARLREFIFKYPSDSMKKRIKANLIDKKELWIEFIVKGKMSSPEMADLADFKAHATGGYASWLIKYGIIRKTGEYDNIRKGAYFEIYPEVIPDLKKLIGIE